MSQPGDLRGFVTGLARVIATDVERELGVEGVWNQAEPVVKRLVEKHVTQEPINLLSVCERMGLLRREH